MTCIIPNCRNPAPASEPFCKQHIVGDDAAMRRADALQDLAYYNGAKQALNIAEGAGLVRAHEWLAQMAENVQLPAVRELKGLRNARQ